jgi:PKD repeat protein
MYPVTLTVTSANGSSAKTKSDYVQSFSIDAIVMADNVYRYKPHFSGFGGFYDKTILYGNTGVSASDLSTPACSTVPATPATTTRGPSTAAC